MTTDDPFDMEQEVIVEVTTTVCLSVAMTREDAHDIKIVARHASEQLFDMMGDGWNISPNDLKIDSIDPF